MGNPEIIDQARLNFSDQNLWILNLCIAFVMFGIALNLKWTDFKELWIRPSTLLIGLFSQIVFLPAITLLIVFVAKPAPSIALGMFMVAACPGGSMSNFITSLARGNVALSVSMTAITTTFAVLLTPLNFTFWSNMYPGTASLLRTFDMNAADIVMAVFFLLALPLFAGMWFGNTFPGIKARIYSPVKLLSITILFGLIILAFFSNFHIFLQFFSLIMLLVMIHNGLALSGGYWLAKALKQNEEDSRAISIETGIQNAALGLVLIFNFFEDLGGMAIITAWWGVWHLIAGMILASFWSRRKMKDI